MLLKLVDLVEPQESQYLILETKNVGAKIKGQVIAESVQVQGTLEGQIRATSVALLGSAHVTGEILHRSLSIEAGAFIEGNAKRIDNEGRPNGKITPLKLSLPHGSGEGEGKQNGAEKTSRAN